MLIIIEKNILCNKKFILFQREQENYKALQENEEKLISTAFYKLVSYCYN